MGRRIDDIFTAALVDKVKNKINHYAEQQGRSGNKGDKPPLFMLIKHCKKGDEG